MNERRKSLIAVYFILFLDNFGSALIFPIFSMLLLNPHFHVLASTFPLAVRNIFLGILLTTFPFAQFFGAPFFGELADRISRKKALTFTICGVCFGYLLTAFGVAWTNFITITIGRLITGFFAGNLAICMAVISDLNVEKKQREKSLSYLASYLGVGWILALVFSSFFVNPHNLRTFHPSYPFWIAAFLNVLSLFVLLTLFRDAPRKTGHPQKEGLHLFRGVHHILQILDHKEMRLFYLMLFFWFFGFFISGQWITAISIEKFHITPTQIKWLLISLALCWTVGTSLLNPWLISRFSLWKIMLSTLFIIGLFYFFSAVATHFYYFAGFYGLTWIVTGITWSNSMSIISLASPEESQGKSLGIAQSILACAQFVGPLLGGITASFSINLLLLICSFFVFISFALLLFVIKRKISALKTY